MEAGLKELNNIEPAYTGRIREGAQIKAKKIKRYQIIRGQALEKAIIKNNCGVPTKMYENFG